MPVPSRAASIAPDGLLVARPDLLGHSTRRVRSTIVLAGLITSGVLAATSLLAFAAIIRVTMADTGGLLPMLLIATGTVTATSAGSWAAQPLVNRLVARIYQPY